MSQPADILLVMTDHTSAQVLWPASRCLTPQLDALAAANRWRFQRGDAALRAAPVGPLLASTIDEP